MKRLYALLSRLVSLVPGPRCFRFGNKERLWWFNGSWVFASSVQIPAGQMYLTDVFNTEGSEPFIFSVKVPGDRDAHVEQSVHTVRRHPVHCIMVFGVGFLCDRGIFASLRKVPPF